MSQQLKYLSRIRDEFDAVICGVNGVIFSGGKLNQNCIDTLIKLYQSGKKVTLASNSGQRVNDLFRALKYAHVPMNIFSAMITAGEIAHFYLKNNPSLGHSYYKLGEEDSLVVRGLDYKRTDNMVMADFLLAETHENGLYAEKYDMLVHQALDLKLPMVCVGNNTLVIGKNGVVSSVGALAEQYAMLGGKIIPFGKPDVRIAAYLTEEMADVSPARCLVIGDCMSTDIRMGNQFKAKTLLITAGVHQILDDQSQKIDELSESYGLNVDYYMEDLSW